MRKNTALNIEIELPETTEAYYQQEPLTRERSANNAPPLISKASVKKIRDLETQHQHAILNVLERAATDFEFATELLHNGSVTLKAYSLTMPEKAAIISGDIVWIQRRVGSLDPVQKRWLKHRLEAMFWDHTVHPQFGLRKNEQYFSAIYALVTHRRQVFPQSA